MVSITAGIELEYIVYAALLVAICAFLLALVALYKSYDTRAAIRKCSQIIRELKNKVGEQERIIAKLTGNLSDLEIAQKKTVTVALPKSEPAPMPQREIKRESPEEQLKRRVNSFILEYNALMNQRDNSMAAREAKKQFVSNNSLRGFDCINYEKRMNHPELEPIFAESPTPAQATFWAMQIQGEQYAVVPNLKAYEGQVHQIGGMKEVFDSNFQGGSYSGITVVKPAYFTGLNQLIAKGELSLMK